MKSPCIFQPTIVSTKDPRCKAFFPLTFGRVELDALLPAPPDGVDVGRAGGHDPVVVVDLPPVEVDEDAPVQDVGDGGRAHQGRVGDVDGLELRANAPVGAGGELEKKVWFSCYPRHNGWPNSCSFFPLKGTTVRATIELMMVL